MVVAILEYLRLSITPPSPVCAAEYPTTPRSGAPPLTEKFLNQQAKGWGSQECPPCFRSQLEVQIRLSRGLTEDATIPRSSDMESKYSSLRV